MDLYYIMIIISWLMNEGIACTFLSQIQIKASEINQVLYNADESSVMQCTHRCMLIDKTSMVDFKGTKCRCVKYERTGDGGMDSTFTGFLLKKVNGGLSDNWIRDGDCTKTCGGGTLTMIKTCTNPAPQHGGKDCPTKPTFTTTCNTQDCPCERTTLGGCCKVLKDRNDCWWHGSKYVCYDTKGGYRTCMRQKW